MPVTFLNRVRSGGAARAFDADVLSWEAAVIANGGTVSLARRIIVDQFVFSEKASNAWSLTDDYHGLWGENAAQSLTSIKQRRLATATNSPTFTADRGYTCDGVTNYIDTGFVASTHAIAMTENSAHLEVYERTNVSGNNSAAGTLSTSAKYLAIRPRSAGGAFIYSISTPATYTLPVATSLGLTQGGRNGTLVTDVYGAKNGVDMVRTADPTVMGTLLPDFSLILGAHNNAGTPASFRATSLGFISYGAALSGAQRLARYNAVQAWATAVGAQV